MGHLYQSRLLKFVFLGVATLAGNACVTPEYNERAKSRRNECSYWSEAKQNQLATDMIKQILADRDLTSSSKGQKTILEVGDIKNSSGHSLDTSELKNSIYDNIINSGRVRMQMKPGRVELQEADPKNPVSPDFTSTADVKFAAGSYQLTFIFKSTSNSLSKTFTAIARCDAK